MRLILLAMLAVFLVGCCGTPQASPALTLRSPVGVTMESAPQPMRVAPAYSYPQWTAPTVPAPAAPTWQAPSAQNPCLPQPR